MEKINKYLQYVMYALLGLSLISICLVFFGGNVPDQAYTTPVFTDQLIYWSYILIALTALAAIGFPMYQIATKPKQLIKLGLLIVGFGLIVLISYFCASDAILTLPGYDGSDNVPGTLIFADMVIFTSYILLGGAVLAIIVTPIIKKFLK